MFKCIPSQYGDIDAHLAQVEEDINNDKKIPKNFSGLGVLDFEEWFALYNLNFKNGKQQIYRDETENLEGLVADPVGQYNEAAKYVIWDETITEWCRYNAVNFFTNIHKRRPIARGMGCFLWIQHLIDILPQVL